MTVFLHAIETAVPGNAYAQRDLRDLMRQQPATERRTPLLIRRIYDQSGIDRRHSVIADLRTPDRDGAFYDAQSRKLRNPTTGERNDHYTREARTLFEDAARAALNASSFRPEDVTHVVTVSCTGFFAPGPDYHIVRALNLSPNVRRSHLGFMGCCAAFPALRTARDTCLADPDAVVLVVSAELCSLHYQQKEDVDTLVANAVFADGAAGAVVSARPPAPDQPVLQLDEFATTVTPTGEEDMAWTIGDNGFEMVLSSYVPAIIGEHIAGAFEEVLNTSGHGVRDMRHWAVHPGGRAILDRVQDALQLTDEQMHPSREVLREHGNMSSATVLFILRSILHAPAEDEPRGVAAMAFGPGLTVETAVLTKPAVTNRRHQEGSRGKSHASQEAREVLAGSLTRTSG